MDKHEYLNQLRKKISRLPSEEVEDAIKYYYEYFNEVGDENYEKAVVELGDPSVVAAQILADSAVKNVENNPKSTKKGMSAVWLVILAVCAAPIALPFGIAILAVAFAMLVTVGALIFAAFAVVFSLIIAGITTGFAGLSVIGEDTPTAIMFFGGGLFSLGLGMLLVLPVIALGRKAISFVVTKVSQLINKSKNKTV